MALIGTSANDSIRGTSAADLIDGRGGNDTIDGQGGNDTFVFAKGYGSLEVHTFGGAPSLHLEGGISSADLHVSVSGQDLLLTDGYGGDSIILDQMWATDSWGVHDVRLDDGTVLTRADLVQIEMTGTSGNDNIRGAPGAHVLDGKGGDDTVVGAGGSDTFVFNTGYGHLLIEGGYAGTAQPVLTLGSGISAASLHVSADSDRNLHLSDGVVGDDIVIQGAVGYTDAGIAKIRFSDGSELSSAQLLQMEMTGTAGDDTIFGSLTGHVIDGHGGNDQVFGYDGNDTIVFNAGYGQLSVNESLHSYLKMGAGILASDIKVTTTDGSQLYITDGIAGDKITVPGRTNSAVDLNFADGTVWTAQQLVAKATYVITGKPGNDTLIGTAGSDYIDGKGGNDLVYGLGGVDTIVFNEGYGRLEVYPTVAGADPIIQMGAGIRASDLGASPDGGLYNLTLVDGVGSDRVTYDGAWYIADNSTKLVSLNDGTQLSLAQFKNSFEMAIQASETTGGLQVGTAGADIFKSNFSSTKDVGNGGSDTFSFSRGFGLMEIDNSFGSNDKPVLELSRNISVTDLTIQTNGTDIVIGDGAAGDAITLDGMYADDQRGVLAVSLGDGTVLGAGYLRQAATQVDSLIQAMAVFSDRSSSQSYSSLVDPHEHSAIHLAASSA
jgi:Ca2+-binding RTX toxin-like protein